jgi:hypothetical protein
MTVACDLGEEAVRLQSGRRELLDALDQGEDVDVVAWRDRLAA